MHYDVIVIGGGLAGCCAATAASRLGAKVMLVERYGFLGGWSTAALVNPFMTHKTSEGKTLVAGMFNEVLERLDARGGLLENLFDSEMMKYVLQEMVLESGSELLLHAGFEHAAYDAGGQIAVTTRSKLERTTFLASRLIDCSGDGDAAVSLGANYESGDERGLVQAVTLMFDMGGVDTERAMEYVRDNPEQMLFPKLPPDANPSELADGVISVAGYFDLVSSAKAAGEYDVPGDMVFYLGRPRKGEVVFNTTHVGGVDGLGSADLTRAEIECRRQMMDVVAFAVKYMPGFENAYLLRSAPQVGVRETRRVLGDYVFSANDVVGARKFEDAICRLAYPVDVHSGRGEGYTRTDEPTGHGEPPPGDWYEIPFRCLLPRRLTNVLMAGRCVSSTQAGHGAIRIMPACAAMGEAAGTAAALSIADRVVVRNVDTVRLKAQLRGQGALV